MQQKILLDEKNFSENVKKFPYFKKNKKNNFFIFQKKGEIFFKDPQGSFKEDFFQYALEDIYQKDLIIIYGVGIGYHYLFLKKWLREKKKYLVFIEEDPFVFERFLQTNIAEEILKEEKVRVYFKENIWEDLPKIIKKYAFLKFSIKCLPYYKKKRWERFLRIKEFLEKEFRGKHLLISYYSDFGKVHLKNIFFNLLNTKKIYFASSLKNRFKNIPAIICGAGPSLKKDINFLKKNHKKALVFAGGTSGEILEKKNISFDFLSHIDKENFLKIKNKEVPFIYQNQMYFKNIFSKKILARSEELFPLEKWMNEKLGLDQETIKMGWTVGTFLVCFATFLGCNPIILTGMDLSYKNIKYPFLKKDKEKNVLAKNVLKEEVYTQNDWIVAAQFLEKFIKDQKTSFYRTREEGLFIKGMQYGSLKDLQKFFLKDIEKDGLNDMEAIEIKDALKVVGCIKKSVQNCLKISSQCLKNQNFIGSFLKLQEEIFFKKHLIFLWNVFTDILKRETRFTKEEEKIHQMIFFQGVCQEFLKIFKGLK